MTVHCICFPCICLVGALHTSVLMLYATRPGQDEQPSITTDAEFVFKRESLLCGGCWWRGVASPS